MLNQNKMFVRRRTALMLLLGSVLLIATLYKVSSRQGSASHCDDDKPSQPTSRESCNCAEKSTKPLIVPPPVSPISCEINADVVKNVGLSTENVRKVNCLISGDGKKNNEVFLPFSFIKSYFDVMGEVKKSTKNDEPYFSWSHSYSRVFQHLKETKYDPAGTFMQFAGFDVENRPRVKCVTASQGVPLTTQWDTKGYYYSTQVCQYALAHWSKHVMDLNDKKSTNTETLYEDGGAHQANWVGGDITRVTSQKCIQFEDQIRLPFNNDNKEFVLGFDLQFRENVTITVTVRSSQSGRVKLRYIPSSSVDVDHTGRMAIFGYGVVSTQKIRHADNKDGVIVEGDWKRFTRNLINDFAKGLPHKAIGSHVRVEEIAFEGVGCVTNLTLSTRQSLRFFFHAADWLLQQQDGKGGWPVGVTLNKDKSKYSQAGELTPGWYSGMGQGHAMSVLTRAYRVSKDEKYLSAAVKAIDLFEVSSSEGGVVARFMDTSYVWYEEYPTRPSSFILNGFMYSLLGLYDLWATLESEPDRFEPEKERTKKLFDAGVVSLEAMLPFFDTGSGSVYDLRHFSMKTAPKVARWDYHSTHINLLYTLSTLVDEPAKNFLLATADRWLGYMTGSRSKHN